MKIYVAGHNQEEAKTIASMLASAGHQITSRWLYKPFNRTEKYTEEQRRNIADDDLADIDSSDCLVLLSSPCMVPGGKFVEFGYALGRKKQIVVIGARENMLMWNSSAPQFTTIERFMETTPPMVSKV